MGTSHRLMHQSSSGPIGAGLSLALFPPDSAGSARPLPPGPLRSTSRAVVSPGSTRAPPSESKSVADLACDEVSVVLAIGVLIRLLRGGATGCETDDAIDEPFMSDDRFKDDAGSD